MDTQKTPAQRAVENGWKLEDALNELYAYNKALQDRHDALIRTLKMWFLDEEHHSHRCRDSTQQCDCHVAAIRVFLNSYPGQEPPCDPTGTRTRIA